MNKARRFLRDESGMTMGLTIIMIVLIGVMGAGLLTFVQRDLNAVVETNQGQRAFEMADAGVQAAKQQLKSDSDKQSYDGGATADVQWSSSKTNSSCGNTGTMGMCLNDLDVSATTTDRVNVAIEYVNASNSFKVISTGTYGDAKRKIEAVFQASTGTNSSGIPAYYTPGSIQLKKDAAIDVSMFAGGDIRFGKSSLVGSTTEDPLGDWNIPPYNTTPRKNDSGLPYTKTGLAAEGFICASTGTCSAGTSIADGIVGYDSTTGTKAPNKKKFVEKMPPTLQPQDSGTITYPYSRSPNAGGLLERAKSGSPNVYDNTAPFDIPNSTDKRVHFIDAGGATVSLDKSFTFKGVLVIRCGNLDLDKNPTIEGIVMVIKGDGASCADTGKINIKQDAGVTGYVYAGSEASNAIDMDKDARLTPPPTGAYDEYLKLSYLSGIELLSWRELYQ